MKEKGEAKPRQHTIDLSQMAVPIQLSQEKKTSPESPRPSSSEAEPSTEYSAAGTTSLQSAAVCVCACVCVYVYIYLRGTFRVLVTNICTNESMSTSSTESTSCFSHRPRISLEQTVYVIPGKVSRVGVSLEGDDVVMSSNPLLAKPFKTSSSQVVTMVTKPAVVSAAVSHISHMVRKHTRTHSSGVCKHETV